MARNRDLLDKRDAEIKNYFNTLTKGVCKNWRTDKIIEEKVAVKYFLSTKRIYAILAA